MAPKTIAERSVSPLTAQASNRNWRASPSAARQKISCVDRSISSCVTWQRSAGLPANTVHLVGETTLADLKTRPDYAVTVSKALVGFIEVKAPGKGADPRKFTDPHDKEQWDKLKSLPNLIYTDGNAFSLWRDGKLEARSSTSKATSRHPAPSLKRPQRCLPLISDFLRWAPIPPKTAKKLAQVSARLCRLLRDEVIEQMAPAARAHRRLRKTGASSCFRRPTTRNSPTAMRRR